LYTTFTLSHFPSIPHPHRAIDSGLNPLSVLRSNVDRSQKLQDSVRGEMAQVEIFRDTLDTLLAQWIEPDVLQQQITTYQQQQQQLFAQQQLQLQQQQQQQQQQGQQPPGPPQPQQQQQQQPKPQ